MIALTAAFGLIGASPGSADAPVPKPGKWKGTTTQLFSPPKSDAIFELNREVTFRLKRAGRYRTGEPRFKIVEFDTELILKTPFNPCGPGGFRTTFSEESGPAGNRYRFTHTDSENTVYIGAGRVEYFEAIRGKFTGRTKAKGSASIDYFDSVSYEETQDCTTGRVRWTAHRVR